MAEPRDTLDLWDYRKRVTLIYDDVREAAPDQATWQRWRDARDELFRIHPQSAIDEGQRQAFTGLDYFPYDPAWRFLATVEADDPDNTTLHHSAAGTTPSRRFGVARFFVGTELVKLPLYWFDAYGGGVFLPFRGPTHRPAPLRGGRPLLHTPQGPRPGGAR